MFQSDFSNGEIVLLWLEEAPYGTPTWCIQNFYLIKCVQKLPKKKSLSFMKVETCIFLKTQLSSVLKT